MDQIRSLYSFAKRLCSPTQLYEILRSIRGLVGCRPDRFSVTFYYASSHATTDVRKPSYSVSTHRMQRWGRWMLFKAGFGASMLVFRTIIPLSTSLIIT